MARGWALVVPARLGAVGLLLAVLGALAGPGVPVSAAAAEAAVADSAVVRRLRPRAMEGDASAQFLLGSLYYQGRGVPRDLEASVRWFRAAAENGHPLAQHNLGNAYMNGDGVPVDDLEAMRWWRMAGEQDVAAAQFNLGLHLYYGRGVAPDRQTATEWISRAADNGHAVARQMLANLGDAPTPVLERIPDPEAAPSAPRPAATASADVPGGVAAEGWLGEQDPDHFTLQLLSTSKARALRDFVQRHQFADPVATFHYERKGQALIGLVHGAYATRAEARGAADRVRRSIAGVEPWIRQIASVQKDASR